MGAEIPTYVHLLRAKDRMDREYASPLDVPTLAREAHASTAHFSRSFSHWVLDQDEALDFYTNKLGFRVHTDERLDGFRWLTVCAPRQPDHELILLEPGPPMMDETTAEQVKALVAKGVLGPGAFEADDCKRAHTRSSASVE